MDSIRSRALSIVGHQKLIFSTIPKITFQFVASKVGVNPDAALNLYDDHFMTRLVHAMSIMEVGRYYSVSDAAAGSRACMTKQK